MNKEITMPTKSQEMHKLDITVVVCLAMKEIRVVDAKIYLVYIYNRHIYIYKVQQWNLAVIYLRFIVCSAVCVCF